MADDMTKSISTSNSTSIPASLDEHEEGEKRMSSKSTTTTNTTSTTTTTTTSGRAMPSPTWRRDRFQGDFQSWWSQARQCEEPPSALDFLVKMGLEKKMVQKFLWETLVEKCPLDEEKGMRYYTEFHNYNKDENEEDWYDRRTRVDPGIIDYYCRRFFGRQGDDLSFPSMLHAPESLPIFYNYARLVEAAFISRGQNPCGVSERDLLTLLKLAGKAETDEGDGSLDIRHAAVHQCMRYKNYTAKFMQDLIKQFCFGDEFRCIKILGYPGDDRQQQYDITNIRNAIGHDCLLGIKDILDQGVELLALREHFWTERAFRECLHLLPQTEYLGEVTLLVPEQYVEDPTTPDEGADFVPHMELDCYHGDNHKCRIDNLNLQFTTSNPGLANPNVNAFPGGHYAIQSIFSMPDLQVLLLDLGTWPLATAAPYLMRAIQEKDKLEKLCITVERHGTDYDAFVMSMLTALKHNYSIAQFEYSAANGWPFDKAHFGPYETQLLEILQHNTTLSHVQICHTELGAKLDYLLGLNKYGRRLARDPQIQVEDFVAQLSSSLKETLPTPEDEDFWERISGVANISLLRKLKNDNALGICYGLLRESPDSWCTHAFHQPTPSKRRRLS